MLSNSKIFFKILNTSLKFNYFSKGIGLIHKNLISKRILAKNFTANTKTKSEVRGGGRKPWKQKGTGRARAGSIRSPLWVGGGTIFGPRARQVSRKINKKENKLSLILACFLKTKNLLIIPDTSFNLISFKTKHLIERLYSFKITTNINKNILIVLKTVDKNLQLSSRNLKNVHICTFNNLNIFKILKASKILISNSAFITILKNYE